MKCHYCKRTIELTEPGHGWTDTLITGLNRVKTHKDFWHSECIEMYDDIPLEDMKELRTPENGSDTYDSRGYENQGADA